MKRQLAWALFGAAVAVAAVDVVGLDLLLSAGMTVRPIGVADLDRVETGWDAQAAQVLAPELKGGDPEALLARVMNLVPRVGPGPLNGVDRIYAHVKRGGGLLCAGMSELYFNALRLNGYRARIVAMRRSLFNPSDTHTSVEVFVDGAWRLYDPTFHVAYRMNGRYLDAEQIREVLHHGDYRAIEPVFLGEVRYPARLGTYYMNWLPLYNHVWVEDARPHRFLQLPPLRYWFGPVGYYATGGGVSAAGMRFFAAFYAVFVAVLPLLAAALALGAAVAWLVGRRDSRGRAGEVPVAAGPRAVPVEAR